jgi:holo-[acyl-carrier protein] synthase
MIIGIGTDIVQIERIQQSIEQFGDDFARRILTAKEFEEYQQSKQAVHFLAKRFAIKEAAAKAFGTGFREGLSWQHISVVHNSLGAPDLHFSDKASVLADKKMIKTAHVSVSDEHHYVVAFVILES